VAPVFGVLPEGFAFERVDFVSDYAGNSHSDVSFSVVAGRVDYNALPSSAGSTRIEP
jgi:hypothetical protein